MLALKHYTSKIRDFGDLESIETLGFRGEALSSLCVLSDLIIITRHNSDEFGSRITYDNNGRIIRQEVSAREQGTTVVLSNLFSTLPVRKREFAKNLKREFNKMCHLLHAYCLVCKNIRFSCTNQTKTISCVVTTEGGNTIRENIISIFGTKQISTLIDVELTPPDDDVRKEYDLKSDERLPFSFELIISSVAHGHGRSTTDRQFFYVNSRPCELTKVTKLINDVYRQFNNNQYPFVYLNIIMEKDHVDVNVTPDKRQVFIAKEKMVLATVKASLLNAFKTFPSTVKLQSVGITNNCEESTKAIKRRVSQETPVQIKRSSITELFSKRIKIDENCISARTKNIKQIERSCGNILFKCITKQQEDNKNIDLLVETIKNEAEAENRDTKYFLEQKEARGSTETFLLDQKTEKSNKRTQSLVEAKELLNQQTEVNETILNPSVVLLEQETEKLNNKHTKSVAEAKGSLNKQIKIEETILSPSVVLLDQKPDKLNNITTTLDVTITDIRNALTNTELTKNKNYEVKFHSKISPDTNAKAEKELQKQLTKEMFKQMSIVGQFNYGFIITKLNNDLFIVDQHATDEKYNFEQLQATTVLERQVLVKYAPLENVIYYIL